MYAGVTSSANAVKISIVQRPNRPDVSVYLQPAENNNSVKMRDEFLHGLVAAGCLCAVTFWPFCLPNLSVMHLCPEAACCLARIIYGLTFCNLSIHFFLGIYWVLWKTHIICKLDNNKLAICKFRGKVNYTYKQRKSFRLAKLLLGAICWFCPYLPPVIIGVVSQ